MVFPPVVNNAETVLCDVDDVSPQSVPPVLLYENLRNVSKNSVVVSG
jgi:hypothetical protein